MERAAGAGDAVDAVGLRERQRLKERCVRAALRVARKRTHVDLELRRGQDGRVRVDLSPSPRTHRTHSLHAAGVEAAAELEPRARKRMRSL